MKNTSISRSLITLSILGALSTASNAVIIFQFTEEPDQVNLEISGSLDLSATLSGPRSASSTALLLVPTAGNILGGSSVVGEFYNTNAASGATEWAAFGTGAGANIPIGSGDRVALFSERAIGVPTGYTSGSSLSGFNILPGESFASLGLALGEHTTTFNNGPSTDSVIVRVGAAPIPEPSSALTLAGLVGLGLFSRRRRA